MDRQTTLNEFFDLYIENYEALIIRSSSICKIDTV